MPVQKISHLWQNLKSTPSRCLSIFFQGPKVTTALLIKRYNYITNRFHNQERLKSRKEIGRLFGKAGKAVNAYPIRMAFAETVERRGPFPFQAAFVVPKRRFKKAADRNRIKRLMREAYRLKKHLIGAHTAPEVAPKQQFALMFIYTGKEEMTYKSIEKKMVKILQKFAAANSEAPHRGPEDQ